MPDEPTDHEPTDHEPTDHEPTDHEPTDHEPTDHMATPPPPPLPPSPAARRLVRDPYTRLGGVASGIAHYYGFDVSMVRILFVMFTLLSGTGLLVYILAWLVIPRAEHWPPPPPERTFRSLTGRDMGLALALFGIVLALAVGIGSSGGVLIPLVLVAGGVWLLIQPLSEVEPAVADGVSHRATGSPPPPAPQIFGPGPAGPLGAPVPPRSRRRVIALVSAFVIAILVLVVTPLVLIGGAVYHFSDGFEDPPTISYTPTAIDTEPVVFDEESADLVIDLTGIDASDFAGADQPLEIRADVEFGEITVLVPTGVDASVDADATLGDVRVFGQTDDGYRPRITHREPEAEIELELDLRFGQIDVQYAAG